ncbi:MAG: TetR/AcrR family transcriptional regulator [Betaproteobacteria bacterium]
MTHLKRPLTVPLRERILASARELFHREGINAVSVDAIAAAAGTSKMSVYRNFPSKDDLIVAYLDDLAAESDAVWAAARAAHPDDPEAQLRYLLRAVARMATEGPCRGCAVANAAVELAERKHPARRAIEAHKLSTRERLVALCREAGYLRPASVADELFLLVEGARVSVQSAGPGGPGSRLLALAEALLAAAPRKPRRK